MPLWSKLKGLFGASPNSSTIPERVIPVPNLDAMRGILEDLEQVAAILKEDGEDDFSRGVGIAVSHMKMAITSPEESQGSFAKAADTYRSMWGGLGSMTKFYIVNGTTDERERVQNEYEQLIERLNQAL